MTVRFPLPLGVHSKMRARGMIHRSLVIGIVASFATLERKKRFFLVTKLETLVAEVVTPRFNFYYFTD